MRCRRCQLLSDANQAALAARGQAASKLSLQPLPAWPQLVISYCTKRTGRLRALEMAMFNAQAQQHGRPTPEHWRRVMVRGAS